MNHLIQHLYHTHFISFFIFQELFLEIISHFARYFHFVAVIIIYLVQYFLSLNFIANLLLLVLTILVIFFRILNWVHQFLIKILLMDLLVKSILVSSIHYDFNQCLLYIIIPFLVWNCLLFLPFLLLLILFLHFPFLILCFQTVMF